MPETKKRPSYKTNDPKGYCGDPKRGAALGRPTFVDGPPSGKLTLRQVRLDSGGYDENGTYWGLSDAGQHVYWFADDADKIDGTVWAKDRDEAKREIVQVIREALKSPGLAVEFMR